MTVRAQPIDGAIDVEAERALTPGCFEVLHLNNAGCALPIHETIGNQIEYLVQEATHGGYETAAGRLEDLDRLYSSAAELLGASSSEIAFTHSATDSWWRAFSAIPLEAGDTVLVGQHEFISGAIALIQAAEAGVVVRAIPNDELGRTDVDALANLIDDSVKLICITQYPMTNGLVNPAAEVGKLAKECGAFYLLDACQAVGQTPVDVAELGCDFLAATGRK